eukprot:451559-Pelagomonas_calceolata.AAC.1
MGKLRMWRVPKIMASCGNHVREEAWSNVSVLPSEVACGWEGADNSLASNQVSADHVSPMQAASEATPHHASHHARPHHVDGKGQIKVLYHTICLITQSVIHADQPNSLAEGLPM